MKTAPATADTRLVDRMRARLEAGYWPRVHCMILVTIAGAAAFLTSFMLMELRVRWMAVRYGVAALAGYLTFLLLLSAWVRWKWSRASVTPDGGDILDIGNNIPINLPSISSSPGRFGGGGGRSGGGGASGTWGTPSQS